MKTKVLVLGFREKCDFPGNIKEINVTSRSKDFGRELSPFLLGPVSLWNSYTSKNVENAWQYSKVYAEYTDDGKTPNKSWYKWAEKGWGKTRADRYPMGKGAKPVFSWWNGEALNYISARSKIYIPLYASAVRRTDAWKKLRSIYQNSEYEVLVIRDFDGYNQKGMSLTDILTNSKKPMGHGFVLCMMLRWGSRFYKY